MLKYFSFVSVFFLDILFVGRVKQLIIYLQNTYVNWLALSCKTSLNVLILFIFFFWDVVLLCCLCYWFTDVFNAFIIIIFLIAFSLFLFHYISTLSMTWYSIAKFGKCLQRVGHNLKAGHFLDEIIVFVKLSPSVFPKFSVLSFLLCGYGLLQGFDAHSLCSLLGSKGNCSTFWLFHFLLLLFFCYC